MQNELRVRFRNLSVALLGLIILAPLSQASQTRTWTQNDYSDFERGIIKDLSLRSDGLLTLAPKFDEIFDTSSAYLWAVARDSKGNTYAGGGPGAKLYRLSPRGDKKTLAVLDGLDIHAIAIDSKDRVYAATSPDGKVYRVSPDGKCEVFYDPKAKYIWALVFNKEGDLFVATGDGGAVHRVKPDGHGSVFFKSEETHVRSMAIDPAGNLILGTDPGGLVLRVSPAGESFVLYQMSKMEVTSVAVAKDGCIYAAGVGSKSSGSAAPPAPAASSSTLPATNQPQLRPQAPPPASLAASGTVSMTGSDLYRIDPDGNPEKIWSGEDTIYAIAFDPQGRVLLGSGNKGFIYRIDSDVLHTALVSAPSTQVTAFVTGTDGVIYAVTGNVGKVYRLGPGLAPTGSIESDVFDAGFFSQWGRLSFEANVNGGSIAISTRSGNLDEPERNWSHWSAPIDSPKGDRVVSPSARFIQWKGVLTANGGQSPELEAVSVAYLQRNVAPRIEAIEITPPNYKFPAPPLGLPPSQSITLPPIGKASSIAPLSLSIEPGTPSTMPYAKSFIGARWTASDENGDSLIYTIEIRGVHETNWKLLKDKVKDKYLSWDTTAFPDGEYRIRVTASDSPSNPPADALTASSISDPFLIDNTPPRIDNFSATQSGGKLHATWKATDPLCNIKQAEYSLDGGDWTLVAPVTKLSDSLDLSYDLALDHVTPGEHTLTVRVEDDHDNEAAGKVVVP
jgi:hypothetical protein